MTGRERYLNALQGKPVDRICVGSPTSLATYEEMRRLGIEWPDAHYDAAPIALLAERSYTDHGYDSIMPYFSIILGAAALGADIEWGEDPWEFEKSTGKIISGPRMPRRQPRPTPGPRRTKSSSPTTSSNAAKPRPSSIQSRFFASATRMPPSSAKSWAPGPSPTTCSGRRSS